MEPAPLDDQSRVLVDVVGRLERAGIEYMISGSVALSAYVRPRMTRDIDVVVAVDPNGGDALIHAFAPGYYLDDAAVRRAVAEQRLVNAVHEATLVKVDLVIRKSQPFRIVEFGRRRPVTVAGRRMWVVSAEDLLLSKLVWRHQSASAVQLDDARMLAQLPLDWPYVEEWAAKLDVLETAQQLRP